MSTKTIVTRIRYNRASAAEQLDISLRQLDYLRKTGELTGRRDGGSVYFDHEELVSYARSRPSE